MRALLAVALTLMLAGCVTLPATIAPSSQPLARGKYTVIGPTTGKAYGVSIFGIPILGMRQAGLARDRAIEAAKADALVNIAGDATIMDFMIVSVYWTTIEADAVTVEK